MPTMFSHASIFFIGVYVFVGAFGAMCPPGWSTWQDSCYILLQEKMNWSDGLRACDRPGGNMIIPNTKGQHDFIWETISPLMKEFDSTSEENVELWIGCKDNDNDTYVACFSRSGLTNYTNWAKDNVLNTGEDCIKMSEKYDGKWGDDECTHQKFVVCEMVRVSRRLNSLTADAGGRFVPQCLLNHGIKNLEAKGVIGCGQACWAEPRCHSFNLMQLGEICQLNNATSSEVETIDQQFVDGCSFFSL